MRRGRTQWSPIAEQREEAIVAQILEYLTLKDYWAWRTHDARHKPLAKHRGIQDIHVVTPRGFVAIEVKAADGVMSTDQDRWRKEMQRRGISVLVARSLDDVMAAGL